MTTGTVHQVRHARGGEGSTKVWQYMWQVRGSRSYDVTLVKCILSYIWNNLKSKAMFHFLL